MPFAAKIALAVLGLGTVFAASTLLHSAQPCATTQSQEPATTVTTPATTTETTATEPCYRRRGLRDIFNSRRTVGGGTDVGK